MTAHDVRHVPDGHRGVFVIEREGKSLATMSYSVGGPTIIINHTEVDDSLRGTGAGAQLVEAVVGWARAERRRIMPLCPFARSVFAKRQDYADVLA